MRPFHLLALVLSTVPTCTYAEQIYRWVGADGVVHFSEHLPPGVNAEAVSIRSGSGGGEQATEELKRLREKAGLGEGKPPPAAGQAPAASAEQQAESARVREENCRIAQENQRVLENAPRVMVKDAEGNPVRLDDDQREARLAETRKQIEQYCGPQP